jgi:hypothetical protein
VRQALESPLRFASPVHVVDGVSPTPARLHSPKGGDLPMRRRGLASGPSPAGRVYAPAIGQRSWCTRQLQHEACPGGTFGPGRFLSPHQQGTDRD